VKKHRKPAREAQRCSFSPFLPFACLLGACMLLASCFSFFSSRSVEESPLRADAPSSLRERLPPPFLPEPSACFSLALPMQSPMKSVSEKIALGADAARRELERQGTIVHVRLLDSDRAEWLEQLAALPQHCVLVGGPLQSSAYASAKKAQAVRRKVFFAFLPQLEAGDEGFTAWRFFPSPEDQVEALLNFTGNELGFTAYGILYPDEPYGRRMAEIFRTGVLRRGGSVRAVSYAPATPASWPEAAGRLTEKREINDIPFPAADLHAVFLPDSWSSVDQLITSLHYNGEDKALLLGSSIWGEGIRGKPPAMPQQYRLAVFPGVWHPALSGAEIRALRASPGDAEPDFWHVLGYDFVRFASGMSLPPDWTPQLVNRRAAGAQHLVRTMAPIRWNAEGKAEQTPFLFTPVQGGFAPLNAEDLKYGLQEAQTRFLERLRTARGEARPSPLPAPGFRPPAPAPETLPAPAER
jgi:hypothetical protein